MIYYYSVVSVGVIAYLATASPLATSAEVGTNLLEVNSFGGSLLPSVGICGFDTTTLDVGEQKFKNCLLNASNLNTDDGECI